LIGCEVELQEKYLQESICLRILFHFVFDGKVTITIVIIIISFISHFYIKAFNAQNKEANFLSFNFFVLLKN